MADTKPPSLRIVPGAPPPPPLSKTQKKKRKSAKPKSAETQDGIPDPISAALVEQAPQEEDVKEGSIAPELIAQPSEPQTPTDDSALKPSPIIELLNKRTKALYKKMIRIQAYSMEPPERLNEDQLRLLKTLPSLEGAHKELEEVKKAIATHEAEVAQEAAAKRAEVAKAERDRLLDAVAAAESVHRRKAADLVTFARLHELRSSGHPVAVALDLTEHESAAIFSANQALFGDEPERKGDVIHGFFTGQGEHLDVPYSRFVELTELFLNPPRVPTPEESIDEQAEQTEEDTEEADAAEETPVLVTGLPSTLASSGSFHFMQDDELANETGGADFDETELIDKADIPEELPAEVEVVDTVVETTVNGHTVVEESVTITTEAPPSVVDNKPIDWADEEGGLPPIAGLHERFGTSGDATPVVEVPETKGVNGGHIDGTVPLSHHDEDGFVAMRGRGRGGRGSFRGEPWVPWTIPWRRTRWRPWWIPWATQW
ncbi:hypothetical protein B0H21DRAFT_103991 [Amylocystis lapponica]|nr:hypothetical protein B0H21DRAFT_103991 [Amylocystis lapponica]